MKESTVLTNSTKECIAQKRPPYHPFNPNENGLVDEVREVVAIALPKGTDEFNNDLCYPPSAQGFADFSRQSEYAKFARIMLQSFLLGVQMKDIGTKVINLHSEHPDAENIATYICKKESGKLTTKEAKILSARYDKYIKDESYGFDINFAKRIMNWKRGNNIIPSTHSNNDDNPPITNEERRELEEEEGGLGESLGGSEEDLRDILADQVPMEEEYEEELNLMEAVDNTLGNHEKTLKDMEKEDNKEIDGLFNNSEEEKESVPMEEEKSSEEEAEEEEEENKNENGVVAMELEKENEQEEKESFSDSWVPPEETKSSSKTKKKRKRKRDVENQGNSNENTPEWQTKMTDYLEGGGETCRVFKQKVFQEGVEHFYESQTQDVADFNGLSLTDFKSFMNDYNHCYCGLCSESGQSAEELQILYKQDLIDYHKKQFEAMQEKIKYAGRYGPGAVEAAQNELGNSIKYHMEQYTKLTKSNSNNNDNNNNNADDDSEADRRALRTLENNRPSDELTLFERVSKKVKVIVTKFTGDGKDVGYVVFFFKIDPNFNFGRVIKRITLNQKNNEEWIREGSQKSNFGYRDPWPCLSKDKTHAVKVLTDDYYKRIVSMYSKHESFNDEKMRSKAELLWDYSYPVVENGGIKNPFYPPNTFTIKRALELMKVAGADASQCSEAIFNPHSQVGLDVDGGAYGFEYRVPPNNSWWFDSEAAFWDKHGKVGFKNLYFPDVKIKAHSRKKDSVTNTLERHFFGDDNSNNLVPLVQEMDYDPFSKTKVDNIKQLAADNKIISKLLPINPGKRDEDIKKDNGKGKEEEEEQSDYLGLKEDGGGGYSSNIGHLGSINSLYDLKTAFANDSNQIELFNQEREELIEEKKREAAPFKYYCEKRSEYEINAVDRADPILKAGNKDISKPMQAIMDWMEKEGIGKVSTYLPHPNVDMDTTANMIIRDAIMIKHHRHIAEEIRHWYLCHVGLMDCLRYDHDNHLNLLFSGMSQTGKSFFLMDATKNTWIPGTCKDILQSSSKAENTDNDITDLCIVKDEVDDIFVDAKAFDRDKTGKGEKEKSKLTECRLTYAVLVLKQNLDTGKVERITEYIETDFVASYGACTNKQVKLTGEEALASRFAKFTICRPQCQVYEFMGLKNRLGNEDTQNRDEYVHHLRIVQMISAVTQKLIQMNILEPPVMDCFNVMMIKMLDFLRSQGIDTSEQRQINLMERFAYQLTIRTAIMHLYMSPVAPLFGKRFMIRDLITHGDWLDPVKLKKAKKNYEDAKNRITVLYYDLEFFKKLKTAKKSIKWKNRSLEAYRDKIKLFEMHRDPSTQEEYDLLVNRLTYSEDYLEKYEKCKNNLELINYIEEELEVQYTNLKMAYGSLEGSPGIKPYLYATKQITIFTWTLMGELLIDPVTKIVLDACSRCANVAKPQKYNLNEDDEMDNSEDMDEEEAFDPLKLLRNDVGMDIKWRGIQVIQKTDATYVNPDEIHQHPNSLDYYDINYIRISHDYNTIGDFISQETNPKVSPQDCKSYMTILRKKFIRVYLYNKVEVSKIDSLDAQSRSDYIVEKDRKPSLIPIVRYDSKGKCFYVAVEALRRYNIDILKDAVYACIYDGWRDGQRFIFGLPYGDFTEVFQSVPIERSHGKMEPVIKNNERALTYFYPVEDKHGYKWSHKQVKYLLDPETEEKIMEEETILDNDGNLLFVEYEVPKLDENGKSILEKQTYVAKRRYYKVLVPEVKGGKILKSKGGDYKFDNTMQYVLVEQDKIYPQKDGLITISSMGPAFLIADKAHIPEYARVLLKSITLDPNKEPTFNPKTNSNRDNPILEIREDLDDWALERLCLRNGIYSEDFKYYVSQKEIMERIRIHSILDKNFKEYYSKMNALSSNYPHNISEAILKSRKEAEKARRLISVEKSRQFHLDCKISLTKQTTSNRILEAKKPKKKKIKKNIQVKKEKNENKRINFINPVKDKVFLNIDKKIKKKIDINSKKKLLLLPNNNKNKRTNSHILSNATKKKKKKLTPINKKKKIKKI